MYDIVLTFTAISHDYEVPQFNVPLHLWNLLTLSS